MTLRLDNRPLLGKVDRDLFLPPTIMPELQAAVDRKLNVLIMGSPGSGKTTLLRTIAASHEGPKKPGVYVDLNLAQNAEQALEIVDEAIRRHWETMLDAAREEKADLTPIYEELHTAALSAHTRTSSESTPSNRLLQLARGLGQQPASLLLVDSPPGEGSAHTLFGRLRDVLWQRDHQWVIAANNVLRDELTRPPANAFFDVQLDLAPLSRPEQREFLARRLAGESEIDIDSIVGQTDGLPRSLLQLARAAALSTEPVDELLAARDRRRARLAELPPLALTITEYLADHGPASGSDPQLLATLGVSGQRARQVLRQLEEQGFVRSFPEQQERQGRPRKLYELLDGGP